MTYDPDTADRQRFAGTDMESHLVAGRVSRHEFLRHGSVLGGSMPALLRALE